MAYRPSFEGMRLGLKYRTMPPVLAVIALMLLTLILPH